MDTALQAAWEAGDILLAKLNQPHEVTVKGLRDVVTEADVAAQRAILNTLQRSYPEHRVLAEEGVGRQDFDGPQPIWVIDPLDGTTNYTRRFPAFCVSIGLILEGEPHLGVIHDPLAGRTFIGERGVGAHLLTQSEAGEMAELRASPVSELPEAVIGLDWPHDNHIRTEVAALLSRTVQRCRTARTIGAAALALAYVAAGWLDGYFHFSLQPWDAVAGVAMLRAAGAHALNREGQPWQPRDTRLIAGAPAVVAALLELARL
ncbi:MAG: inositol monophosphatase family protein [Chloroflexi bacterium]|nr:inositol monophosphatase family protein [Chloroflexota bacterium]